MTPGGKSFFASSIVLMIVAAVASAFDPGSCEMPRPMPWSPLTYALVV